MFIGHYPLDLKHGSQKIIKYTYNPKLHIKVPLKQRVVSIYLQAHFHKVAHVAQSRRESGVQKLIVRLQVQMLLWVIEVWMLSHWSAAQA